LPQHPDDLFRAHFGIRVFLPLSVAVDAGKVTPRGEADAEVGYRPAIGIPERFCYGHVEVSAFKVLCNNVYFRAPFTGRLGGIGLYGIEMFPYGHKQLRKVGTLEGFDHEVPAGF